MLSRPRVLRVAATCSVSASSPLGFASLELRPREAIVHFIWLLCCMSPKGRISWLTKREHPRPKAVGREEEDARVHRCVRPSPAGYLDVAALYSRLWTAEGIVYGQKRRHSGVCLCRKQAGGYYRSLQKRPLCFVGDRTFTSPVPTPVS